MSRRLGGSALKRSADVDDGPDLSDMVGADEIDSAPAIVRPKLDYTDEQMAIITCPDRRISVDAFAGCAKTTTAIGFAEHRPGEQMLYLCLNASVAEEARQRFPANVTASTTHAIARQAIRPHKDRVTDNWRPILLMDEMNMQNSRAASHTLRVLADFFNSGDTAITERHAEAVKYDRDLSPTEVATAVAFAKLAWQRMNDPGDKMKMPHDAYLKMFALRAPQLTQYGTIIFDERQDANPVTLQILEGQKHAKFLTIGDRHQQIYGFRGSINASERLAVGASQFHLSQTFRFGPQIAELANLLLSEWKGEKVAIRGLGSDKPFSAERYTLLSRTNAELFRQAAARRGEGVHWVGGKTDRNGNWRDGYNNYRIDGVMDAYHLFSRDQALIVDDLMRRKFASWEEYAKYAEDSGDGEARILVKVVEEFGHDVPQLVADIKANAVPRSEDAALTLTTAHKSKGLEWDFVQLADDFEVLEDAEAKLADHADAEIPEQDINLLYVALTRAKHGVKLNAETEQWIKDLPRHRANREAAASRGRFERAQLEARFATVR